MHPFTIEELRTAFALITTQAESEQLASNAVFSGTVGDALTTERCFGVSVTTDTLVLLSLVSDDLFAKVERFRSTEGLMGDAQAQSDWTARREALRRHLSKVD